MFFGQEDAVVVASAPRYLILRLKTSLFKAIAIAGHAPHSGATDAEIVIWWETLASTIPDRYAMWPRILLVDANARIGGEPCNILGHTKPRSTLGKRMDLSSLCDRRGCSSRPRSNVATLAMAGLGCIPRAPGAATTLLGYQLIGTMSFVILGSALTLMWGLRKRTTELQLFTLHDRPLFCQLNVLLNHQSFI